MKLLFHSFLELLAQKRNPTWLFLKNTIKYMVNKYNSILIIVSKWSDIKQPPDDG